MALKRRGGERMKTESEVVATKTKKRESPLDNNNTTNTTHSNTIVAINSTVITQLIEA